MHVSDRGSLRLRAIAAASVSALGLAVCGAAQAQDQASSADTEVGEIVVTGSRVLRSGFTTPTPVTVVGAERMEQLGITDVGDALAQLPSFRGTVSPNTSNIFWGAIGARLADLRSLGPQRTLVLVNGRRHVGSTSQGTVDLNLIPSSLVQRTEVVTGGASAAYGSDAVAGVVNLILDTDFTGLRGQASIGTADAGDYDNYQASMAAGSGFGGGRGHIVVGAEWAKNQGAGTQYSRDWGREEWNVIPNPLFCNGPGPGPCAGVAAGTRVSLNGLPANVLTSNVHTATMTPGGVIKTIQRQLGPAVVPSPAGPLINTAFNPDGTPRPFQMGNLAGPIFMEGGEGAGLVGFWNTPRLAVPVEHYSLYSNARYDLTDSLRLVVEGSYGHSKGENQAAQTRDFAIAGNPTGGIVIRRDNPFIPAQIRAILNEPANANIVAFNLGRQGDDFGPAYGYSTNAVWRVVAGLEGDLGENWSWDAYYQYGRDKFRQYMFNDRITANWNRAVDAVMGAGGSPVCRVNADAVTTNDDAACRPLNPFGENNWSPEARDYAFGEGFQRTTYSQHVIAANLRGDLFALPAGDFAVAAGGEYRDDKAVGTADPISQVQGFYVGNAQAVNGQIKVLEGYVEAVAPLVRDQAFAKALELNGAVRQTHYKVSGPAGSNTFDATTWKVGAVWDLNDWLRLRATRSRDIRAPNIDELFVTGATFLTVRDPNFGNAQRFVFSRLTGNPTLEPEKADTLTVGVVLSPKGGWAERLRFSADYYDIEIEDAISRPTGQTALDRCAAGATEFCSMLTRNALGELTEIATPNLNIQSFKMSGADFELDYAVGLDGIGAPGDLSFRLLATWVNELVTTDTAGSIDRAGQTGFPIGLSTSGNKLPALPHWTFDGSVTWDLGALSLTAQGRYIPKGTFDVTLIGPDNPAYAVTLPNSINDNRVDDRFYLNLAASYEFQALGAERLQLFGVVNNVFDKDPPVAPGNGQTNLFLFDTIGRTFKAGMRFRY